MAEITICGGDWEGTAQFGASGFAFARNLRAASYEVLGIDDVTEITVASEDRFRQMDGTFGPVLGAIVCKLLGRDGVTVTFAARFKDGRALYARADQRTFAELRSSCLH